jgi:hypothetical protein
MLDLEANQNNHHNQDAHPSLTISPSGYVELPPTVVEWKQEQFVPRDSLCRSGIVPAYFLLLLMTVFITYLFWNKYELSMHE